MSEKPFPKSRILNAQKLVRQILESNKKKRRFCFILGAGASVESGIPSGNSLQMKWMNCLMGKEKDGDTLREEEETLILSQDMENDGLLEKPFSEIRQAWSDKRDGKPVPNFSEYYFDIYRLRFHPDLADGYRYLEEIMEKHIPSIGYYPLALMLTANEFQNNLVITTNFESLVEDALFTYTDTKPLVAGHESEAAFIDVNLPRPIIAKVHRNLFFEPFNTPDTTKGFRKEWQEALQYVFQNYTPIVIGYGGGDHSLMDFLEAETTRMRHGVYWCFLGEELPDHRIQKLVMDKEGWLVRIDGFDALMLEIGKQMFGEKIIPSKTEELLKKWSNERIQIYNKKWSELNKEPTLEKIVKPLRQEEEDDEKERGKKNQLTFWDYIRRGDRLIEKGDYENAIAEYSQAIQLEPDYASAYNNRGVAYSYLNEYKKAITDFQKVMELNPDDAFAFNNRGLVYQDLKEYEKAIVNYKKAIELQPDYADAYYNRGNTYHDLKEYEKAIADYTKATELNPACTDAYLNRGIIYKKLKEYEKAITDYTKAIELQPDYAGAYNNRGYAYGQWGKYEEAMADIEKVLEIDPDSAEAYDSRGFVYGKTEKYEEAIEDLNKAIQLKGDDSEMYRHRAEVYRATGQTALAEADEAKAEELERQGK